MIDRIVYAAFFLSMSALCLVIYSGVDSVVSWLLLWLCFSGLVFAAAYLLNRPRFVCGKDSSGSVSIFLLLINLPWLLFTWSVWVLFAIFDRGPKVSPIPGAAVSISRYPLWSIDLSGFDRVFDLTAEFPCFYGRFVGYRSFANLDGVALSNFQDLPKIRSDEKVLIHCAQGHGRSATFASLLLAKNSIFFTPEQAYEAIISVRPKAKLATSQRRQLGI